MKKQLNFDHPFNQKLLIFLITISIAPPTAFLISVLSLSFMGKPYSLRDVLIFIPIITFILFWIVLVIINQYLRLRSPLGACNLKSLLNTKSLLFVFIPLLLFIAMFTWILFNVEDLQGINYLPPNYRYQLKIFPDENSSGEICIEQITNYRGDIFNHNRAIQDLQITGNWQQNKNRCLFYLESGNQGVINIDYVGAIDDTLTFLFQVNPDSRAFNISSSPGQSEKVNLLSEINGLVFAKFKMGTFLLRNITDWGVLAGLFSAAIIFLIIIYLVEKSWIEKADVKPFFKTPQYQKFVNFLSQPISDKAALFIVFFMYVIGVILTIFITQPLAVGPSHFGDEVFYWKTAFSLYDGRYSPSRFSIAPPLYPISLLPAFYLFYPENAYLGAKILNALYLTSAIFPAYLLLRIFLDQKKSILIASLLLLNPAQIIFPPRILSENLFLPLLLWAILLGFKPFDQPDKRKPWMSVLFGVLLSLLYLTRYIGLAIMPALFIAWWLKPEKGPVLDLNTLFKKRIKSFMWVLIPMGLILGTWIVFGMMDGLSTTDSIGVRFSVNPRPWLTMDRFLMWGVFYLSYTILLAAPFVPILLSSILDFKNIDAERKRWAAMLLFVVVFVLIICVRHSWRSGYNYPVPLKIQGRYIFFFNHLFLMTSAILFLGEFNFIKRIKIFVYSYLMVSLVYAIIQIGFIFMDHPLKASVSSSYGRFMDAFGSGFLTFSLILILLFIFLPYLKQRLSKSIAFLFILGFYILGGIKVFKVETTEYSQLYNSQIYYLINEGFSQCESYLEGSEEKIEFYYHKDTEDNVLRYWKETLSFYGLTDAELIPENRPEKFQFPVFRAEYGDCKVKLRYLYEEDFHTSTNPKFSYGREYFDYQKDE